MKKIMSLALALVMLMSLSVTAFAADTSPKTVEAENGTAEIAVSATYKEDVTSASDTYNVVVTWSGMEFTYTVEGTQTWNAETHKYDVQMDETGTWSESTATVTVTNHSNVAVTATLSFAAVEAYNTVTGKFDNGTIELPSAVDKATNAAELTGTAKLTLEGTLASTVTESTNVGTITVTIAKAN